MGSTYEQTSTLTYFGSFYVSFWNISIRNEHLQFGMLALWFILGEIDTVENVRDLRVKK